MDATKEELAICLHSRNHNKNKSLSIDLCFINHPKTFMSDASYHQKLNQIRQKYGHADPIHPSPRTIPNTPRRAPPTFPTYQTNFNPPPSSDPRNTYTTRDNDRLNSYYDQIDTHRQKQNARATYFMKEFPQSPRITDRNINYALHSPSKTSFPREYDRPGSTRTPTHFYHPENTMKMPSYSPLKEYPRNQTIQSPTFKTFDTQQQKPVYYCHKDRQNEVENLNLHQETPYFQADQRGQQTKRKIKEVEEQPCYNPPQQQEKRNLSPTPHSFKNLTIDITEDKPETTASKEPDKPLMFTENIKNIDKIKQKIQAALHRNKHIK